MTSLPENNYSIQRLCLTSLPDIVKMPRLWKTETLAFPFLQPKFFSASAAVILDPIQLPRIRTELSVHWFMPTPVWSQRLNRESWALIYIQNSYYAPYTELAKQR